MRPTEQLMTVIQEARISLGIEKAQVEADFRDRLYLAQVAASADDRFASPDHLDRVIELHREKLHHLLKRWVELVTSLLRSRYGSVEQSDGDVIFTFAAKLVEVELASARETLEKSFPDEVLEAGMNKLPGLQRDCLVGAAIEIGAAVNYRAGA
ncbi:MAG: hypothetical protein V2A77_09905 [Pseudomonadota bacterium]